MSKLAQKISTDKIIDNKLLLYWLGGAGFIIKNNNIIIGIDVYLSNSCEDKKGNFKRLVPSPLEPEELNLDYLISTHEHGDHLDIGSLNKFINSKTNTKIIGPRSVIKMCKNIGIDCSKLINLDRGENKSFSNFKLKAVFADHGKQTPDCIGVIITLSGKNIYFTSDTCYRPDLPKLVNLKNDINLLIVPINGTFGNPDPKDASYITAWVKPDFVVPCHFWLFKEHGGDPGKFVKYCSIIAPEVKIKILAIGEGFSF